MNDNEFFIGLFGIGLIIVCLVAGCQDKNYIKKCKEKEGIIIETRRDNVCLTKEELEQIIGVDK